MILFVQQSRWDRRDAKKKAARKFKSDNRKSVRGIIKILINKAKKLENTFGGMLLL